jgi:hypothetical protein
MSNTFNTYIPKFLVNVNRENEDIIFVSSSNFSALGDVYTLDKRAISPNVIQTTQSLNELQPEVSSVYPFKVVTPVDIDGSTIILTPTIENVPTASQHYYAPVYFERYRPSVILSLDKTFTELDNAEFNDSGDGLPPL